MGNGREDLHTTYHFLVSLQEPINRLPEDMQMFLRMKIQEVIFQETPKQKGTESSTSSSQMQLFRYEDGRSNQGERGQHLTAQSFFQTFQRVTTVLIFEVTSFPLSNIRMQAEALLQSASGYHTTPAKPQRNTNTHRTRAMQPMK